MLNTVNATASAAKYLKRAVRSRCMELSLQAFPELKLFITGPTYLSERVKRAALLPEFGHRDSENERRLRVVLKNLGEIMQLPGNCRVMLLPGTGSTAMEASIRSLVRDDERVLCVSVGAFGDLYANIARRNKPNVDIIRFPDGSAIDESRLAAGLEEKEYAAVTITHNETSTGVINRVGRLGKIVRDHGALPLIDGVSILGGASGEIKEGQSATYVGSTQKCLALPAGFGIAAVSDDALEKAEQVEKRGLTTDLLLHAEKAGKFQTLTTPNTALVNQLYVQTEYIVKDEGVETRFARHRRLRDITLQWLAGLPEGFSLFPGKENSSPSLTCIRVPESLDRKALKEKMREQGYLFDPGYGKISTPTIRIGHMGDITEEMLKEYLETLGEAFS